MPKQPKKSAAEKLLPPINGKQQRGFRLMSAKRRIAIARAGGLTISSNRKRMAELGRIGGRNSAKAKAKRSALKEAA